MFTVVERRQWRTGSEFIAYVTSCLNVGAELGLRVLNCRTILLTTTSRLLVQHDVQPGCKLEYGLGVLQ